MKRLVSIVVAQLYIIFLIPQVVLAEASETVKLYITKENESVITECKSAIITKEKGGVIELGEASILIPAGALDKDTEISISRLKKVQSTGETLCNVTTGSGGYRFLPAGQKFSKEVLITLPYSKALNVNQSSIKDLYTYFYSEDEKRWIQLERESINTEQGLVTSKSTHFTDMINATLTLPEAASPLNFNINSIKNLEAANPGNGVIQIKNPEGNQNGDANFSFELPVPNGRRGMQPQLILSYSSSGGNGLMGKGFDINYGSLITTDTRHGLPQYDGNDTYVKDGILLQKDNEKGSVTIYKPLKENAFERIERYTEGQNVYNWVVTDRSGKKSYYGQSDNSKLYGKSTSQTFTWLLEKQTDTYGNTIRYSYNRINDETDGSVNVYVSQINYTGFGDEKGYYDIDFDYEERTDIRTEGRGKFLTKTTKRLKSITTKYGENIIRSYEFNYKEGLAGVSLLTEFTVKNSESDSYSYCFEYEQLPEQLFSDPVLLEGAGAISVSNSVSTGSSVNMSAGGGVGYSVVDVRATVGKNASSSSGYSYSDNILLDINGDGKADRVFIKDGNLCAYLAVGEGEDIIYDAPSDSNSGTLYSSEIKTVNGTACTDYTFSEFDNSVTSTRTNGWSAYAGVGVKVKVVDTSLGASYSKTKQNGTSYTTCTFADVDNDGLLDVLETGKSYYLRNTGISGSKIQFLKINLLIDNEESAISDSASISAEEAKEELADYKDTYYTQTPFRAWRAPYDGEVSIDCSSITKSETDNSEYRIYYGSENAYQRTVNKKDVESDNYFYFVSGLKNESSSGNIFDEYDTPEKQDIEWNISIKYVTVKPFKSRLEPVIFFPEEKIIITDCSTIEVSAEVNIGVLAAIYDCVTESDNDCNNLTYTYTLKEDWQTTDSITKEDRIAGCAELINQGLFVATNYTESQFYLLLKKLADYESKTNTYDEDDKEDEEYELESDTFERIKNFADNFYYDSESLLYKLEIDDITAFYKKYFEAIKGSCSAALSNYDFIINEDTTITPVWNGETPVYYVYGNDSICNERVTSEGVYAQGSMYSNDSGDSIFYLDDINTGNGYESLKINLTTKDILINDAIDTSYTATFKKSGSSIKVSVTYDKKIIMNYEYSLLNHRAGELTETEYNKIKKIVSADLIKYKTIDDEYWSGSNLSEDEINAKKALLVSKGISTEAAAAFISIVYKKETTVKTVTSENSAVTQTVTIITYTRNESIADEDMESAQKILDSYAENCFHFTIIMEQYIP